MASERLLGGAVAIVILFVVLTSLISQPVEAAGYGGFIVRVTAGADYTEEQDVIITYKAYRGMHDGTAKNERIQVYVYVGDMLNNTEVNVTEFKNFTMDAVKYQRTINLGPQNIGTHFVRMVFIFEDYTEPFRAVYTVEHTPDPYSLIWMDDGKEFMFFSKNREPFLVEVRYDYGRYDNIHSIDRNVTYLKKVLSPGSDVMSIEVIVEDQYGNTNSEDDVVHVSAMGESTQDKFTKYLVAMGILILGSLVSFGISQKAKNKFPFNRKPKLPLPEEKEDEKPT